MAAVLSRRPWPPLAHGEDLPGSCLLAAGKRPLQSNPGTSQKKEPPLRTPLRWIPGNPPLPKAGLSAA